MTLSLNELKINALVKLCCCGFSVLILALTIAALFQYKGHLYIYLLFSAASNVLLYFGFRKNAIFFDTFIGVFFWLGFWLKLTIRVVFMDGIFIESVGNFDGSGSAFDHALLAASCGFLGLLAASYVREKFVFTYPKKLNDEGQQNGLLSLYKTHRKLILWCFSALFITIAITNVYFGIYQKGTITRIALPYGLSGIYKWLLLFGLASISALILKFEFTINKKTSYLVVMLSLLESFFSSISLLSRGMILNVSALVYGALVNLKLHSIKSSLRFLVMSFLTFAILFGSSVFVVNYMRSSAGQEHLKHIGAKGLTASVYQDFSEQNLGEVKGLTKQLFLDRFVGIEGIMAVSSSPMLGWSLCSEAWKESYSETTISFYDKNLIKSPYINTDFTKHHYISLPGILAFCFYPGSFLILFGSMFLLGLFAAMVEMTVFKLGGNNLIICSLMAQVLAYRYASFGYVPNQTYLIFGALYLNLLLIYFGNNFLLYRVKWMGKFKFYG